MKNIDNDTVYACPVCKVPFDIEDFDGGGNHDNHLEQACHELDIECSTCADDPCHCSYGFNSMMDDAYEKWKYRHFNS